MEYPHYAFSAEFGSFVAEAKYAKELGKYLFYDEKKDIFLDKDGNIVDITGLDIFPRTGVLQADALINAIYNHGGTSTWVKVADGEKVMSWPDYIRTKRTNLIMSGKEILENPNKIIELFGEGHVFFKTKVKNYSQVLDVCKLLEREGNFYKALEAHKDDDFILSDVVDIIEDDYGMREYRCYVVDGKPLNISRVHDFLVGTVSPDLEHKVLEIMESVKDTDFPRNLVIDLFEYKDSNGEVCLDVLECNPIIASGTYLYNSVFGRKGHLNHMPTGNSMDPYDTIPEEKLKYGPVDMYSTDSKVKGRPSICFELPGGFAADLVSFAMFGSSSKGMFIHFDTTSNIDPTNIGSVLDLSTIESDSDLDSDDSIFGRTNNDGVDELVKQLLKSRKVSNEQDAEEE